MFQIPYTQIADISYIFKLFHIPACISSVV